MSRGGKRGEGSFLHRNWAGEFRGSLADDPIWLGQNRMSGMKTMPDTLGIANSGYTLETSGWVWVGLVSTVGSVRSGLGGSEIGIFMKGQWMLEY